MLLNESPPHTRPHKTHATAQNTKKAEYLQRHGRDGATAEDVARAVRAHGRAAVPDSVKAELLAQIKRAMVAL